MTYQPKLLTQCKLPSPLLKGRPRGVDLIDDFNFSLSFKTDFLLAGNGKELQTEMKNNKIFNSKKTKGQRKYLRNNSTQAESRLWAKLKGRQIFDYKFRRQHGIGNYIVDFYCPTLKLVIEVDGESHLSKKGIKHDLKRDKYLNDLGITICRFNNQQIYDNLDGVLTEIVRRIEALTT
jgi:very-short-patch-repair endonuclease